MHPAAYTTLDNDAHSDRTRWLLVAVFAIAMAWLEAACVYYLRVLVDRVDPYQEVPLPISGVLGPVELWREASTIVMLLAVGMLAGKGWQKRAGYTVMAFGVWDIFYYVFLRIISGWPRSVLDWDVLFLLPLPWWGPVLAPVCISLLMIVWGTCVTQYPDRNLTMPVTSVVWVLNVLGIVLALYVFMADSLQSLPRGLDATRHVLPASFNWLLFSIAMVLMAAPVLNRFTGFKWFNQVQGFRFRTFRGSKVRVPEPRTR